MILKIIISLIVYIQLFTLSATEEQNFISPTKRYLSTHDLVHIKPFMQTYGVTADHVSIFENAIANESQGFFGYYAGNREFWIFQDIVRFAIEEILHIPIRKDFHFLRVPGNPLLNIDSAEQFFALDAVKKKKEGNKVALFLSVNIALYENFYFQSLSTIPKMTVAKKNGHYEKWLVPFFQEMGIPQEIIPEIFLLARSKTIAKGVLLQLFDSSGYQQLDKYSYCSLSTGAAYFKDRKVSDFLLNPDQTAFPLITLILNHKFAINPNSSLSVIRYDALTDEAREIYEETLRNYFKTLALTLDQDKVDKFREKLLALWNTHAEVGR